VHVNRGLFRAFKESRPDLVVVLGYSSLTCQLAMYWLSFKRIPWVFWGEIPGFERRGVFGRLMRRVALFPVAWLSWGIAAIGHRARDAYAKLAGSSKPTANIPYFCRNRELLQIQRDPESDPTPRFLYCGQMVVRKGVDLLIQAFCKVARAFPEVALTMVGDGPLRRQLENEVPAELQSRVRWEGFREPEELPRYFAVCNVFVLPSLHDGWGVVINQAVSAGMAVIVSDAVGAGVDLVVDRVNGLIVESNSGPALENALSYFAQNPQIIGQYGQESRFQGERMTPEAGAERWHEFAMQVLGGNRAR
jgi:glycosyltransferase involved in cell wall biosynthesis